MEVGLGLPLMSRGIDRPTIDHWLAVADEAFSSVVVGERIAFRNLELWSAAAAAAVLTRRCRIFVNASVLTAHPADLVAKQAASVDVLSGGRVSLAVGTGVRPDDLAALGAGPAGGEALARAAQAVRQRWSAAQNGEDACGPAPVQVPGPPLLAAVIGPQAISHAASWADGVSGFSVTGDLDAVRDATARARRAWLDAGRGPPRLVTGTFCSVGADDDLATLRSHLNDYLRVLGRGVAFGLARRARLAGADAVRAHIDAVAESGVDELVLIPASASPAMADALASVVADHR